LKKRPDESLAFFFVWGKKGPKKIRIFIKILLRFFFYKTNFIKEFSIGVIP